MARKLRVEIEGGLYHLIACGNDRQDIFHSSEDHLKFLALLIKEKVRSPFFLYAYCLMTNHLHLLLKRQQETVGGIMQRVLGGYSRYYNRRSVFGLSGDKFCGPEKSAKAVLAKEVLILIGREQGAGVSEFSLIAGLDTSNVSRRCDAARLKLKTDNKLAYAKAQAEKFYHANIADSQT